MESEEKISILQFGNGNFLRGFADWIFQQLINQGLFSGGIHSLQIHNPKPDDRMLLQKNQYHVWVAGLENGQQVDRIDLINCIKKYSSIFDSYADYLKIGEIPDLRYVISNTTEAGIVFDPKDDSFQQIPNTFPAKLTALLFHRFKFFREDPAKGLQVLPCELIEKNGDKLKKCIRSYTQLWGLPEEFDQWLNDSCSFYNTLVDRIVPGFPKDQVEELEQKIGKPDKLIVMAEPYYLWAIEGAEQLQSEINWEKADLNIKFVKDLEFYRTRKVRILNGAHTALVPFAILNGTRTVKEAIKTPKISQWLKSIIFGEIIPSLSPDSNELERYATAVLERFANPYLEHQLADIALNSISKFKVRILPSIVAYENERGVWPKYLMQSFAALLLFYKGEFQGQKLPIREDRRFTIFLSNAWQLPNLSSTLDEILKNEQLWETDLSNLKGFKESLLAAFQELEKTWDLA
ncbi:tagaturonate reductase [Algoriphagus sp.]|uniref:tagaturonate reductase n=1 Tax=Algoriphagus sp. TaxID=1872435 RepID=UPI0026243D92|nr:tagaturonate reductase [Algoriphagus sp.]